MRQAWVLVVGIVIAAGLAAYALTDPGCRLRHPVTGGCVVVFENPLRSGFGTPIAPWLWLAVAVVALLVLVLAFSPWARRKPTT